MGPADAGHVDQYFDLLSNKPVTTIRRYYVLDFAQLRVPLSHEFLGDLFFKIRRVRTLFARVGKETAPIQLGLLQP